jgi:hypothetical protein
MDVGVGIGKRNIVGGVVDFMAARAREVDAE